MRKLVLMFTWLFCFAAFMNAQTRQITGTVKSADDGGTLPGVTVQVKGSTLGTISDADGKFSLQVPEDVTILVLSFIGMETQEVDIDGKRSVTVSMSPSTLEMEEVIVVAYGTTTKSSFTGTATRVDAAKIEAKNVSNISQALSGEVAGVQVINTNGQPGSTASIRIRGIGSINGSRAPLYIVDGMPVQGDLNAISPSDIESTTVLKDAAATAIYGSRGANGVVIITTKKGKKGKSEIEVDLKQGYNMRLLPEYDVFTTPESYVEASWSALKTRGALSGNEDPAAYASNFLFNGADGSPGFDPYYNLWNLESADLIDPLTGKFNSSAQRRYNPETWADEMFQQAQRTEVGVRISGGTDKNSFYTSVSMLDDQGYYINSDYKRFTGRANVDHEIRTWLKGNMNMSFMNSESNFAGGQDSDSNNGFWFVANMPPLYPVYARGADGSKIADDVLGGFLFDYGDGVYGKRRFAALTNAVASSTYDVVRDIRNQFSGNGKLEATFLKDFSISTTFGMEYLTSSFDNLGNAFYGGSAEQGGSIFKRKQEYFAFTNTNMLRWKKELGNHNISAFLAQEASAYQFQNLSAFKSNLADPWGLELNNAVVSSPAGSYKIEQSLLSYFGQLSYDFDEKYFLSAVVRRDGSSKFINNKWGTFGSVGAAWVLSKEAFMDNASSFVDMLKLKASYGVIGEQGGISAYSGYDLYSIENLNDELSFSFSSKGNPDLTWEKARMFQVGTEFELFDRVVGSVDYYSKTTDNLLFDKRVGPSLGYAIIQVNDGAMRNSGIELVLDAELVKMDDFSVNFGFNAAFETNKITAMPIDNATGKQKPIDVNGIYGRAVGHSLFDIYTTEFAGVDENTGASQWYRYYNEVDGEKDYIQDMVLYLAETEKVGVIGKEITTTYADATNKFIGKSPIPLVRGSFNLSADFKGFELRALFNYSYGGHGYDANYATLMDDDLIGGNNWHKDILNAWKSPGDKVDVPAVTGGLSTTDVNYSHANRTSDRFVTSTDYLALNNIVLSYSFNKNLLNKINVKGLKLFVSADNLWVGTQRKGFYPNTSEVGASERYQYVALSSFTGGINIKF